jgi:hypothetical protein
MSSSSTMRRFALTLFVGLVALLGGCSATGPAFTEQPEAPKDRATVYVYRPSAFVNSGNAPNLFVNDVDHGQLWNAGYIPLSLPAGRTRLLLQGSKLKWGLDPIETTIVTEAGKTYYVRFGNEISARDWSANENADPGMRAKSNLAGGGAPVDLMLSRKISVQLVPADFGRKEIADTRRVGERGR